MTDAVVTDRLLTAQEVLAVLPVSYPTLLKYVRTGQLPPGRLIAGQIAWPSSEIEAFIKSLPRQTMEPNPNRGRPRKVA